MYHLRRTALVLEGYDLRSNLPAVLPQNPLQTSSRIQHFGDGGKGFINALGELEVIDNYLTTVGGGESLEFQPATPNYEIKYRVWWPVNEGVAQGLALFIMPNWAKAFPDFEDSVAVRLFHAPLGPGRRVQIAQFPNIMSSDTYPGDYSFPHGNFEGHYINVRVWVDADKFFRVWTFTDDDGVPENAETLTAIGTLYPAYVRGPGRRGINIMNTGKVRAYFTDLSFKDRPTSFPSSSVYNISVKQDDFERPDSATIGNGWTKTGNNSGIVGGTFASTGSTDGHRAITIDTAITTGRVGIRARIRDVAASRPAGLVLLANDAKNAGLVARVAKNELIISRFDSVLSGNPPNFIDFDNMPEGINIADNDEIGFFVWNGLAWIEVNRVPRLYAANIHATVPITNRWAGLLVGRKDFIDSGDFLDVEILAAA